MRAGACREGGGIWPAGRAGARKKTAAARQAVSFDAVLLLYIVPTNLASLADRADHDGRRAIGMYVLPGGAADVVDRNRSNASWILLQIIEAKLVSLRLNQELRDL